MDQIVCGIRRHCDAGFFSYTLCRNGAEKYGTVCNTEGSLSLIHIFIGGAAITESFAEEIGADGYSKDAAECVKLVDRLLEEE